MCETLVLKLPNLNLQVDIAGTWYYTLPRYMCCPIREAITMEKLIWAHEMDVNATICGNGADKCSVWIIPRCMG